MGTTCQQRRGRKPSEIAREELEWRSGDSYNKVLISHMHGFREFYALCEHQKDNVVTTYAVMIKISYYKDEVCTKVMDETMGPCYYNCPAKILDRLPETDNKFALEWRKKCREQIQMNKLTKLKRKPGTKLKGKLSIGETFTIVKRGQRKIGLYCHETGITWKASSWVFPHLSIVE